MADVTLENVTPLLQKAYDGMPVEVIFGNDATPFRNACTLESNGAGEGYTFEVISEGSTLVSPSYELAGGSLAAFRFSVKPVTYHLRATVTTEAIDSLKGKGSKAMFDLAKKQLDMAAKKAMRKVDQHLGSKNGAIGTVTVTSGTVLTLANPAAINRLEPGMILVGAEENGDGDLRGGASTPTEMVVESWTNAGAVTVDDTTGFTTGDTIWQKGDVLGDQSKRKSLTGAFDWCDPVAASASEDFHGLDRSTAPTVVQPSRESYSGVPLRAALLRASGFLANMGRPVNKCYVAEKQYTALREEADAREIVNISVDKGNKIVVGCEGIRLSNMNGGTMDVIMWRYCPSGVFLMGDDKEGEFKLIYTDKLVRLHTEGGGLWHRVQDGVTNVATGEVEPALRAEGSLRINLIQKSPAHWHVGTAFTGA
jgi:hypothetical protein